MKIISVEGIDGGGKTSMVRHLIQTIVQEDVDMVVKMASFPRYETPIGQLIQSYLNNEWDTDTDTFEMIIGADKSDFENTLQEWEAHTDIVIMDRYLWTQEAYANANGVSADLIKALGNRLRQPDLTLYLDIPPETTMERKEAMGYSDRYESNYALLESVRFDYVFKCMQDDQAVRLDATQHVDTVNQEGWDVVRKQLVLPLLAPKEG